VIGIYILLAITVLLLIFIAVMLYFIYINQLEYFKKSLDNWLELIHAIKELGRYAE
jgi:hypothetical protein